MSDRSKSVATANTELDGAIGLLLAGERVESVVVGLVRQEQTIQSLSPLVSKVSSSIDFEITAARAFAILLLEDVNDRDLVCWLQPLSVNN